MMLTKIPCCVKSDLTRNVMSCHAYKRIKITSSLLTCLVVKNTLVSQNEKYSTLSILLLLFLPHSLLLSSWFSCQNKRNKESFLVPASSSMLSVLVVHVFVPRMLFLTASFLKVCSKVCDISRKSHKIVRTSSDYCRRKSHFFIRLLVISSHLIN